MNRRQMLLRSLSAGLGVSGAFAVVHAVKSQSPSMVSPDMRRRGLVRPPGSLAEEEFMSACIRCQLCSQACEADAIRLFGSGTGALEGTPYLIPELAACTLCLRCGSACPTGAIEELADMQEAAMGVAVVDEQLCVSFNGTGVCGACHTICPLKNKAITQGFHNQPTVHPEYCVGCGLCEEVCIVKHDKAIRVHTERGWA